MIPLLRSGQHNVHSISLSLPLLSKPPVCSTESSRHRHRTPRKIGPPSLSPSLFRRTYFVRGGVLLSPSPRRLFLGRVVCRASPRSPAPTAAAAASSSTASRPRPPPVERVGELALPVVVGPFLLVRKDFVRVHHLREAGGKGGSGGEGGSGVFLKIRVRWPCGPSTS